MSTPRDALRPSLTSRRLVQAAGLTAGAGALAGLRFNPTRGRAAQEAIGEFVQRWDSVTVQDN